MLEQDIRQSTVGAVERKTIWEDYPMTATSSYHEGERSTLVLYDLRDASAWQRAGDELAAWGKERTSVYRFGSDHVVIEYRVGGLADVQEPA